MKKILSYILISFVVFVNLFAPFGVGLGIKNNVEVRNNKAEATSNGIWVITTAQKSSNSINGTVRVTWESQGFLSTDPGVAVTILSLSNPQAVLFYDPDIALHKVTPDPNVSYESTAALVEEGTFSVTGLTPDTTYEIRSIASESISSWWDLAKASGPQILGQALKDATSAIVDSTLGTKFASYITGLNSSTTTTSISSPIQVTTLSNGDTRTNVDAGSSVAVNNDALLPKCEWIHSETWGGCVGILMYWSIFKPTSFIFALSGKLLDITVDYSTKDTSYRSSFVVQGWGVIRDFCNVFFIFIMLYIAIGTILSLHSVKTKEMIINVVIIGLFINFSLLATQVIIDASNVMTRVFYNSNTIVVGPKVNGTTQNQPGSDGEIQLSAGIISKINPQNLILNASRIDNIQTTTNAGTNGGTQQNGISTSTFILVILLSSAVNIVGLITFTSASLLFITRVIGLWLAMIFSPIVFLSYTIPQLQDTEMIGWKKWWPETIKLAFMAPIFVFFMYLIIKFLDTGLALGLNDTKSGMDFILGIFIPFMFIMILLMKAKSIAKDMSGKMGEMADKLGSAVSGLALGGAVGLGAMAMRGTVGKLGSSIANSDRLKASEARGGFSGFLAKNLRNIGTGAGKASFDARATKAGAAASKGLGVDLGKAKEGGFVKARADKVAYRQKRAKELELGEDSAETQAVRQAEQAYHAAKTNPVTQNNLLRLNNGEPDNAIATAAEAAMNANPTDAAAVAAFVNSRGLGGLERYVATRERAVGVAERALKDASDTLAAIPATVPVNDPIRIAAQAEVARLRANRDAEINGGNITDAGGNIRTVAIGRDQAKNNLEARQGAIRTIEGPIHTLENEVKRLENIKIGVNNQIRHDYAHSIQGAWSNTINGIVNLGEHSALGEREAANKILSGVQETQKITEHH